MFEEGGGVASAFPGSNGLVAFTSDRDVGSAELFLWDTATERVKKVPAALSSVRNPAWSADGTKLAFESSFGQIDVIDFETIELLDQAFSAPGELVEFAEIVNADAAFQPAWSPDGTRIAFTRFDDGREGIWLMNADGSDVDQLTFGDDQDPAWSPDGGSIAFTRSAFGGSSVYVVNIDGSAPVRVQRDESLPYLSTSEPTWSPDGTKLGVVKFAGGAGTAIAVVDVNGGEFELADERTDYGSNVVPAWTPDGNSLMYSSADDGDWEVFSTPASGTGPGPVDNLTENDSRDEAPDTQPRPQAAAVPTCSIASARAVEGSGNTAQMSFPVNCENPTANIYQLDFTSNSGTATDPDDYLSAAGRLEVPPGMSATVITVPLTTDDDAEPHETFTITISSPDITTPNPSTTGTIVDDDGFSVSVEMVTPAVDEGDNGFTEVPVLVRLSHPADQTVRVTVANRSLTTTRPQSLVDLAPNETELVFNFLLDGDLTVEDDELIEFRPSARLINDANSNGAELTVFDDDEPAEDTEAPVVVCGSADGAWHGENASIGCTARDDGSGLADPADAAFDLSTSVPAGVEHPDAATGTRKVCDVAGKCAPAGPVRGNKIDRKAPNLTLPANPRVAATSPTGANVTFAASAADDDHPNPTVACTPTTGSVFAIGTTTVACTATDHVGNQAHGSFTVTVLGAKQQLTRLLQDVIAASGLPARVKALLHAQLDPIVAGVDPTNPAHRRATCGGLALFVGGLRLLSGNGVPAALATRWITDANRIRAVIGC